MLRPYEGGSLGDSNGRIYAIAAHVGHAFQPPLPQEQKHHIQRPTPCNGLGVGTGNPGDTNRRATSIPFRR